MSVAAGAAQMGAKVVLIEKGAMGGDCLNTGCVPSKALLAAAHAAQNVRDSGRVGVNGHEPAIDFAKVQRHVHGVIADIAPHDSVERFEGLGVQVIQQAARFISPRELVAGETTIKARRFVIATGSSPFIPPISGIEQVPVYTNETIFELSDVPNHLLIIGGGPIGCELAQSFARFGSQVTLVEMAPRLMIREDEDVAELVKERFVREGVSLLLGHTAREFRQEGQRQLLIAEHAGEEVVVEFDRVLVAVGRAANISGFGLEELGVRISERKTLDTNEFLQTSFPNIYACGDVAGPYQFTHVAAHQAWYAVVNALFGVFRRFKVDYSVIPFATFTDPEVARVGLNEQEARAGNIPYEVTRYQLNDLDRAIADGETEGFVKVLTVPGRDRILGATIVGEHAGELIAEFVTAMRHGLGLNKILGTIHIYPTWTEANKFAAGGWKRAHAPERLLRWVQRWHRWRRGT